MTTINVYLTFRGNCREAFTFYKSVFGGEFSYLGTFEEMPPQEGPELTEDEKNLIMHVSLPISKETILMGSDTSPHFGEVVFGNNFSISVSPSDRAEADRIFTALSEGGKVSMPMADVFWGSYFGMLEDKFGINWMVNLETLPE
jgi:PhnB protein